MPMRGFLRSLFSPRTDAKEEIAVIRQRERELGVVDDHRLRAAFRDCTNVLEAIAIVSVVASRVLQLGMFDVQLQGALGLTRGRIIEMQTGEGKTLACTPAVAWLARGGRGVHVMTVNDWAASSRRWRP
jgi:preprotein translocase subunit SecA